MSSVFAGTYSHNLDGKNRAIVPAAFRDKLGSGFTIALNSTSTALTLYPKVKWDVVIEQLARIRQTDDDGMDYLRYIMAHAEIDVEMDPQGRILLPQPLREAAGLTRDLVFVGMFDHAEIWDAETYAAKLLDTKTNLSQKRKHVDDIH